MSIAAFIKDLTARGIELYPNGEQLGCRAPEDYLTPAFVDQLKAQKQALLAYLSASTVCELAYTQKGLWYEYQLVPERTDYNISHIARIYSAVDVALLRQAFQRLVNRHPALRATICEIDGAPQQQFHHYQALAFTQIDASGCSWDEVQTLVQRYHQQRFDLSERAFRVFLFTKAPNEHVLLISMHHLFMDGWSIRILYAELEELYRATKQQRIATLPVLEATYAEYVAWQRGMLDAQGEELYSYWSQQLAGELPVLDLPTDRPHAPSYTLKTAKEHFALPTALRSALQDLARQEGVTLATLLLALYQLLLHRYSGQNDIIVGSIMPGRNQAEFEALLGCFLTPLAIRTQVDTTLPFQRFLHQFNQTMLACLNHQEYPFALLVEKVKPTRLTGRSPLFQAAFNMQRTQHDLIHAENGRTLEAMEAAWDWDGLRLSAITGIEDDAPLDLTLHVVDSGDRLQCILSYHPELFDATTIQRIANHFQSLLAGVVANPQATIAALPLLTQAEQHQLLVEWNNTATAYPKDKCIQHLFEEQAARTPDALAVVMAKDKLINVNDVTLSPFDILRTGSCHPVTLTYAELNERANQLAHHLRSLGVGSLPGAETLVGICIERSVEMVVGLLAILKAGGAYVPLDPNYPQERLTFMLQDAQPAVVLTQSHLCERLPITSAQIVICDADGGQFAQQCHENPASGLQGDNLAYVIYTSGSTGQPKGVLVEHRGLVNVATAQAQQFGLTASDRVLQFASLNFDAAIFEICAALTAGATLYLGTQESLFPGEPLQNFLADHQITFATLTPSTLAATPVIPLPALQTLTVAGEACPAELVQQWGQGRAFFNLYGPTEATIWSTVHRCTEANQRPPIGRPIANSQCYVLDSQGQPVPIGVTGELYLGGAGIARGYLNRPTLTADRFLQHPAWGRLYRTGDLCRWLPDGTLDYVGRVDQQVKLRGYRIELGEIEALLRRHPTVQEAVVIDREGQANHKQLVAYLVPGDKAVAEQSSAGADTALPFDLATLRTYLQSKLPEYMVPAAFVAVERIPLTPNGKVDRKALPAPEMGTLWAESYTPPITPTEVALAEIWSSLLGIAQVGQHDSFFQLGGHSLLATQVISRIRQHIAVDLPLRLVFEQPTLAAFAQAIDERRITTQPTHLTPISPADRSQQLPLSYAQQRLWFLEELGSNAAYNMPAVLEITGQLHLAALQQSLSEIVRRHESLRTTFTNASSAPCQIIQPPATLALPLIDLRSLTEESRQAAVKQLCEEEALKPFHLQQDLPLRAQVVQLANDQFLLLLTMHHIASDGWSVGVLIKELATLYAAFRQGQPSPLPELAIQYADFAVWQRAPLQSAVADQQLAYWQNQLADAPALLQLPTDRPRPAQQSFRGAMLATLIDAKLTQNLRQLSQANEATLYMTLLTAFQILLARYSGQQDIVVGSPIANRHRQELEPLIGFFVNTLALRANLSDNPSFLALLAQVKATTQAAYDHQDLPFERLVEEIAPERNLQHNPLVQVIFALQNAPIGAWELPGVQVKMAAIEVQSTRFDLEVHCWEMGDILQVSAIYNRDLFDAATIERLLGHFQTLLAGVVAQPEATAAALPLLTDTERHQLLVEWNNTTTAYPKDKCIHHLFEEQAARTPDAIAVLSPQPTIHSHGSSTATLDSGLRTTDSLTYRQLNERANQLAHHLQSLGVTTETLVGICVERSVEMVVGLLAILKAGGAYVPLDPSYPQERLAFMVQESATPVLLTQSHWVAHLPPTTAQIVCLDQLDTLLGQECRKKPVDAGNRSSNLAYVMYTSGSTGQPKGACVLHRNVVRLVKETDFMHLGSDEVFLPLASPAFDATTLELWGPLLNGGRIVLLPPTQPTLSEIAAAIKTYQVTSLWLTAGLFHLMVDEQLEALRPLRQLLAGGDVLSPAHVQRVRQAIPTCRLINGYGPTENTTFTCCYTVPANWTAESAVPIGRPIANTQVYLLDAGLQPVPIGVAGELYAGGDGVAQGYYQRPELTVEKFIANPFGAGQLYKTGDLCRWRTDGDPSTGSGHCIEFLGRIDQQVKIRGFRIELGEIESVLSQHPAVQEAVVVAREETPGNKQLVAYLVAAQADAESQEEHITTWQSLYEESYSQPTSAAELDLNLTGWNSSYTGQPIPTDEMVEWVENTVAEIRALQPQRVLEIGCGTGLLLARLAPECEVYYGVDYSHQALAHVARLRAADARLAHVQLELRLADDFHGLREGSFDCIILNSIVQYFPTVDYLLRVLAGAARLLVPGGVIYVGDVRNYQLLAAYHASVQLYQAEATLPLAELHARIQQRMQDEEELLLDPAFFHALPTYLPQIAAVQVQVKRGWAHNELTRFRYQVVLRTGEQTSNSIPIEATYAEMDWQADDVTLATLTSRLQQTHDGLLVRQIPDARLQQEAYTLHALDENGASTVAHLRQQLAQLAPALEPEALWQLGEQLGYAVVVCNGSQPGQVDALFLPPYMAARTLAPRTPVSPKPWSHYTNNPLFGKLNRMLIPQIRTALQSQLPDYMLPAAFVLLERLPLTPNGKVDRKALPAPKRLRVVDSREFAPPSTATERALAEIWQQLLDLPQVSIHDNFFDLGGHSLLATQVVSRINATWSMQLPLKSLFERPTVQGLAERLDVLWMIAQQATADDADAMEEGEL